MKIIGYRRIVLSAVLLFSSSAAIFYGYQQYQEVYKGDIRTYVEERDKAFVMKQFKQYWYLLISSPDFDVDFVFSHRAPNKREPQYFGKMDIKVLFQGNDPVGFVAYYLKSPHQGEILFLVVDEAFRGKRYGEVLLKHAFDALQKRGARVVKLVTRVENLAAQKLYVRMGFKEVERKYGFVYYRRELK